MVGVAANKPGARHILRLPPVPTLGFLALEMPPIPLPAYRLCAHAASPRFETAYMSLSLLFGNWPPTPSSISLLAQASFLDATALSVVAFVSFRTGLSFGTRTLLPGGRPSILRTILEDATVYFLVIFSSHLLSLVMLLVTRVSLNLLAVTWIAGNQTPQPSLQLLPCM